MLFAIPKDVIKRLAEETPQKSDNFTVANEAYSWYGSFKKITVPSVMKCQTC